MSEAALDEISVLSAIYCDKDEFEVLEESAERGVVFRIQVADRVANERVCLSLVFRLPPTYPVCPPDVSVSSDQLSRRQCQLLRQSLLDRASQLAPEPVVHELVLWLQQNLSELSPGRDRAVEQQPAVQEEEEVTWTALLLIDHMRNRTRYVKMIERWTSELQLAGRLFLGCPILVLLQGAHSNIKEYIHLQRTMKVDVDSSGKRCKEKMMKILYERSSSSSSASKQHNHMSSFEVVEFSSLGELRLAFEDVGQSELYQEFVPTLQQ